MSKERRAAGRVRTGAKSGGTPAWCWKIDRQVLKFLWPTLRPGVRIISSAWRDGVICGHTLGAEMLRRDGLIAGCRSGLPRAVIENDIPRLFTWCRDKLDAALAMPFPQAKDFFSGLAQAMKKPTIKEDGQPTWAGLSKGEQHALEIYLRLALNWEEVEALRTDGSGYPELLDWLDKKGARDFVADVQQLQRLCHRIGLSMRKPGQHSKKPRPDGNKTRPLLGMT